MIVYIKQFLNNEIFSYAFFGIATTFVSIVTRFVTISLTDHLLFSVTLSNIVAILFSFSTNDLIVFKQKRNGWLIRLLKFFLSRLIVLFVLDILMAYIFVEAFPTIIGQFVNYRIETVILIETLSSQFLIIILNYILCKLIVFSEDKNC